MAIKRAQASVLSGFNASSTKDIAPKYSLASAGRTYTQGAITTFTSSGTWTRPSNVFYVDIALVGSGGGGGGGVFDVPNNSVNRTGGGGGGGAVYQINRFYVGDYPSWWVFIGAGGSGGGTCGSNNCNCNQYAFRGNPTIFTPTATSFAMSNLVGVDSSNLKRTLVAPGGGGGGHPCSGSASFGATQGGAGSNQQVYDESTINGIPANNDGSSQRRFVYQGYGGRGSRATGGTTADAGGGGGAGQRIVNQAAGGAGKALISPFSGTYGAGGNGVGNANGGANTGQGGQGGRGSSQGGGVGGSGRLMVVPWVTNDN